MSAMFPGPLVTAAPQAGWGALGTVLAHQGGWDEILLVAGPIVVIVAVLAVAKRRVDAIDATHHGVDERAATPDH